MDDLPEPVVPVTHGYILEHYDYGMFGPRPQRPSDVGDAAAVINLIEAARHIAKETALPYQTERDRELSSILDQCIEARHAYIEFLTAAWLGRTDIDPTEAVIVEETRTGKDGSMEIRWYIERRDDES